MVTTEKQLENIARATNSLVKNTDKIHNVLVVLNENLCTLAQLIKKMSEEANAGRKHAPDAGRETDLQELRGQGGEVQPEG